MKALCALVVAAALAGCVSSEAIRTGDTEYAPRDAKHPIDIYIPDDAPVGLLKTAKDRKSMADIPADAIQVARADISGNKDSGWSNILGEARAQARKYGGDAVVMATASTPVAGYGGGTQQFDNGFGWSSGWAKKGKAMTVTVIRYAEAKP